MTTQNQLLLDKLQGIYNRAHSTDIPRSFFLALYEFVDIYDKTSALEPIGKILIAQEAEDTKKLKELEQQTLTETEEVYRQVTDYIDKNAIVIPAITDSLDRYKAYKENRIDPSNGQVEGRHGALLRATITKSMMSFGQNKRKYRRILESYK